MTDIQTTLSERGNTHGDYTNHARVTQDIKRAVVMGRIRAVEHIPGGAIVHDMSPWMQETIDMIAHKLGRIAAGDPDFKDHWHDIAGYATLAADRCSK